MHFDSYKKAFDEFFADEDTRRAIPRAVDLLRAAEAIVFVGNGGSNAIASHMMEDYMKMAGKPTRAFSDAALITCFANDYGYDKALAEWVERGWRPGEVMVAISSSGESANILNAVRAHRGKGGEVITLSGFASDNRLSELGAINFHTPIEDYGVVECFHQVILHAILDELTAETSKTEGNSSNSNSSNPNRTT